MIRGLVLVAAMLSLSACAATAPQEQLRPPLLLRPAVANPEPVNIPLITEPVKDSCSAFELQSLIGKPRSQVPAPVYPERRRMACTTCPLSEDVRADRLTILFDSETGTVKAMMCG